MPWPEDGLTDDEDIVVAFRQHWELLADQFASAPL